MGGWFAYTTALFGIGTGPLVVPGGGGHEEKYTGGRARVHCCVDNPVVAVRGDRKKRDIRALQTLVLWLVLGLRISGKKAAQGKQLEWIRLRTAMVTIPDKKVDMI